MKPPVYAKSEEVVYLPGSWYVNMTSQGYGKMTPLRPAHRVIDAAGHASCRAQMPKSPGQTRLAVEGDTACLSCKGGR